MAEELRGGAQDESLAGDDRPVGGEYPDGRDATEVARLVGLMPALPDPDGSIERALPEIFRERLAMFRQQPAFEWDDQERLACEQAAGAARGVQRTGDA